MLERLTLHIGHPKTGTTSIQASLRESADHLAKHGLFYFAGYRNHHPIARTFANEPRRGDAAVVARFRRALAGTAAPHALVSSEVFSRLSDEELAAALASLRPFARQVDAVLYVRHPVAFASSAAHQAIRTGSRIAEVAATPRILPLRAIAKRWESALGPGNLAVRPFARPVLVNGDVIDDLMTAIGHAPAIGGLQRLMVNEGLSALGAVLVERALDKAPGRRLAKAALRPFDLIGGPRYVLPAATLEAVRNRTAADLDWLRARYGLVLPEPAEVPTPAPQLSAAELDTLADTLYRLAFQVYRTDGWPLAPRSEFWRDGDGERSRLSCAFELARHGRGQFAAPAGSGDTRRRGNQAVPASVRDKELLGGAAVCKRR